jgi:hypothetical protein
MVRDSVVNTYKNLPDVIRAWCVAREQAIERYGSSSIATAGRPPGIDCGVAWVRDRVEGVVTETSLSSISVVSRGSRGSRGSLGDSLGIRDATELSRAVERSASAAEDEDGREKKLREAGPAPFIVLGSLWIAWIEMIKCSFVLVVVLLLRLRIVRITPSRAAAARRSSHRRKHSWEQFLARTSTVSNPEHLIKSVHRRRPSEWR